MKSTSGVLGFVDDGTLREDVDRVAAAVGVRLVYCDGPLPASRRDWSAAAAVVLDEGAVRRSADSGLPRRSGVVLLVGSEPESATWQAAISLGAQHVLRMPQQEDELLAVLAAAGDADRDARGNVVTVMGGRGGAGSSIFSAALALAAADALLVDADPWSGGADLLLGLEGKQGLRWPDIAVHSGRLSLAALRDALPAHHGIRVLSGARHGSDLSAESLLAVVEAGRRGGATVVCDVPRRLTEPAEAALDEADLVVLVAPCDVRTCAAASAMAPALLAINPNVGLVVRGPSPGGLRARELARAASLPLLAAMRCEPQLAERIERAGLRTRQGSPLMAAARRVLAVLDHHPVSEVA
jgi:secretion/DNA translocation related CpaE-like protein